MIGIIYIHNIIYNSIIFKYFLYSIYYYSFKFYVKKPYSVSIIFLHKREISRLLEKLIKLNTKFFYFEYIFIKIINLFNLVSHFYVFQGNIF